jgi:chromosome segregation ATPase
MNAQQKELRLKELSEGKDNRMAKFRELQSEIYSVRNEMAEKKPWVELLKRDILTLGKNISDLNEEKVEIIPKLRADEIRASHLFSMLSGSSKTPELERQAKDLQSSVLQKTARVEQITALIEDAKSEIEEKQKTAIRFEKRIQILEDKEQDLNPKIEELSRGIRLIEDEIIGLSDQA